MYDIIIVGAGPDHQGADLQRFQKEHDALGAALRDPEPDGDRIAGIGLGGEAEGGRFIREDGGKQVGWYGHELRSFHNWQQGACCGICVRIESRAQDGHRRQPNPSIAQKGRSRKLAMDGKTTYN